MKQPLGILVLCAAVMTTSLFGAAPNQPTTSQPPIARPPALSGEIKLGLPKAAVVFRHSLQVCPEARRAVFTVASFLPVAKHRPGMPVAHNLLFLVDLSSGVVKEMGRTYQNDPVDWLSPDGRYLLIPKKPSGADKESPELHLVDLNDPKANSIRLARDWTFFCWAGGRAYFGFVSGKGKLQPLQVYNPADGTTKGLEFVGMVVADAGDGRVLAKVNLKAPKEETDVLNIGGTTSLVAVNATSGEMTELLPAGFIHEKRNPAMKEEGTGLLPMSVEHRKLVVSPAVKYLAYAATQEHPCGLLNIADKSRRDIGQKEVLLEPLAVTDSGRVVLVEPGDKKPWAVVLWDNGTKTTLVPAEVAAATIADDRLYYITGMGDDAVLKWMDLPPVQKRNGPLQQRGED